MEKLSSYILTKNSEKHLKTILEKLIIFSDEIIVVDSGSEDNTEFIAKRYPSVKFIYNKFLNFKEQRIFAEKQCTNKFILFVDSDEIPDDAMVKSIVDLKKTGFEFDAYRIYRVWYVLGRKIHSIYPIVSPDHPIRIYNKLKVSFLDSSLVHETLSGYSSIGLLENGALAHYTFETEKELKNKLNQYTDIAAKDLVLKGKKIGFSKVVLNPISAFIKWYFLKNGFKDGSVGFALAKYAFNYTLLKYKKARNLRTANYE